MLIWLLIHMSIENTKYYYDLNQQMHTIVLDLQ